MITKTQAKILYEHYDKMVTKLTEAQVALISGSVKSYKIDDREITRFDLVISLNSLTPLLSRELNIWSL